MAFWPSIVFVLYAIQAGAAKTTLSTELTNLLPACAHDCFTTFLDFNFALTKCGITPTLDCLCTTKSVSEYTVGEGGVQCVLSEAGCRELKNQDAAAFKAYTVCDGRKNALPNTHATLTATMVVESSTTSSAIATSRSNFSASTTITASTTGNSVLPSTLITATQSLPKSTISIPPATSTSPAAEASSEMLLSSGPKLSREQTIGVVVGSSVGSVAIIGLIIFACWRRRRYQRSRDSDMLPFQMDPTNDLNYGHGGLGGFVETNIKGPGGTFNGVAGKVAPKIPPRLDTSSPNIFSRRSLKPDMIGVAISPDNKGSMEKQQRRASRLLPEKPILTLTLPPNDSQSGKLSSKTANGASTIARQSTATQFEEDYDSADTAVAADDSWGVGAYGQSLQVTNVNVSTAKQVTSEPAPPAPAFFVTGGNDGNTWRPGQTTTAVATVQPEYYVKPLNLSRGPVGSFSQPRKPDDYPAPARILNYQNQKGQQQQQNQRPPLQVVVPNRSNERPLTNGSSIYTASLPPSATGTRPQSMPRNHRSYKSTGPYDKNPRHQSSGSLTSFETLDSAVSPENAYPPPLIQSQTQNQRPVLPPLDTTQKDRAEVRRATMMLDLSPVVESPSPPSAKGVSPVSYPKIPKQGRLPENTIRMVPPPAQPDFMSVFSSGRRPDRRGVNGDGISPVENSATPIDTATAITPNEANIKPWRIAEIKAQRERERQAELKRLREREEEARSADIEIGMVSPELPQPQHQSQGRSPYQNQSQSAQQLLQQQQSGVQKIQSFRLGQEQLSLGPLTSSSTTLPVPPRIQPQLLPQQRRIVQEREQQQQQQRTYFPTTQKSIPELRPQQSLQQQLSQTYQAYDASIHGHSQQRSSTAPLPNDSDRSGRLLNPHPSFQLTHTRSSSVSSTSSSLLAKRRGEGMERGMALNLSTRSNLSSSSQNPRGNGAQPERRNSQKWRVLDEQGKVQAKSGDWRPTLATGGREAGTQWVEIDGRKEREMNGGGLGSGLGSGELPRTPGWVPKLTPTRRGDELFLSVA